MSAGTTQPTGKRSKRGRLSEGAPTLRTKALTDSIAESISLGLTDEESAFVVGIKPETLCRWRRIPEFDQALKRATAIRLRDRLLLINARVDNWPAIGWLIERQFPTRFSKPEIQISLSNSFNQTFNSLSINISPEESRSIETVAEPIRARVKEMFTAYRPALADGNGQSAGRQNLPSDKGEKVVQPTIVRKAGDENLQTFWSLFVRGDSDRPVEHETAVFVVRTIVSETLGAHRCGEVRFSGNRVSIADVLAAIDRLVGTGDPTGWRHLLKKAGQM